MIKENPCNCSNCNKKEDYSPFGSECPFNGYDYTPRQVEMMTSHCGCTHHQDIHKYVNSDIIKKFKSRASKLEKLEPKIGTRMESDSLSACYAEAEVLREVIDVLKGGVKK